MSGMLAAQIGSLARRSLLKTLRQPFQLFPVVFFPAILLAVNASGLRAATRLPGFPTHSYVSFAIAVAFIQGGMFSMINAGTNLAEDIESGFSLVAGLLLGVAVLGALQSAVYILVGLIAGAHLDAGFAGALVILALGAIVALGFGALGSAAALFTGSGEAVQGLFPLFFVFIFMSSSNLPRQLLRTGWFHTVASWNPVSYLIEGFRSLFIFGWDGTALWRAFAVAAGLTLVGLLAVAAGLRRRLQRT
jgi:ABC-2 type transport system permease protein